MKFSQMDWSRWRPRETATLTFVRVDGMVLLIRKLRGLGAGLINAPGGRVDPGETPAQGAVREAQEELCVTPIDPKEAGVLEFQFVDGYSLRCHLYVATSYEGVPTQTEEAIPMWIDEREMPYGQMWADDRIWYPLVVRGRTFKGRFLFDGEVMLGCEMEVEPPAAELAAGPAGAGEGG
jgi:8-oxo-dGTP diphosphatase